MKKFDVEGETIQFYIFIKEYYLPFSRHGETPNDEQIDRFIDVCNEFFSANPNSIIGWISCFVFF